FKNSEGVITEFRLRDNIRRFAKSIERSGVASFDEADEESLYELIRELVLIDDEMIPDEYGYSLYIRPTFIGTEPSVAVAAGSRGKLFVICSPVGPFFPCGFKPVSLLACTRNVRAWPGGSGGHKLGSNYGPTLMPAKSASKEGYTQILWLLPLRDKDGQLKHHITEVGSMNVFFVFEDDDGTEVVTPPTKDIILPGITRDSVLKILRATGNIRVSERDVTMEELLERHRGREVAEIFGTGTAAIVCPVKSVTYEDVEIDVPVDEAIGAGPMCRKILDEPGIPTGKGRGRLSRPRAGPAIAPSSTKCYYGLDRASKILLCQSGPADSAKWMDRNTGRNSCLHAAEMKCSWFQTIMAWDFFQYHSHCMRGLRDLFTLRAMMGCRKFVRSYAKTGDERSLANVGFDGYREKGLNPGPVGSSILRIKKGLTLTKEFGASLRSNPPRNFGGGRVRRSSRNFPLIFLELWFSFEVPGDGGTDRPIGIRRIDPVIHTVPKRAEKVHIRQTECRTEFDDVPRGRRIVIDEGRNAPHPRALRPAREASLEEVIGFSDNFFKQGGLIAGAGFVRGSHPRTIPRNSVSWESFLPERPDLVGKKMPFREVERRAGQRRAEGSVERLGEWEKTVLRDTPGANYEELSDDDIEGGGG
ncbi:branched-chain-amino-acid aminotransferase, partial [Perkinsus olseni]